MLLCFYLCAVFVDLKKLKSEGAVVVDFGGCGGDLKLLIAYDYFCFSVVKLLIEMETLVVVAHHKDHHQYYGRDGGHVSTEFDMFGTAPAGGFAGINCRIFESGAGLLPTPSNSCSTPVTKKTFFDSFSPKTPSPLVNENQKSLTKNAKSSAIAIPVTINFENEGGFHFSERWAGPAYSNSPPPSSLPLPKFSMRPKRTVSLELPTSAYKIDLHSFAKSAPSSPTRGRSPSPNDMFGCPESATSDMFDRADSATKTLRRILNLDISDE
ncbi:hypothetical protein BUALT_Bualt13G0013800 [Buddleja alternifolia]|uniref:Uncharacterized protein n=1 Tax=Buddleja alternifolia TaxID=168488 RepID=A0AAV6WJM5_9LAMI|nr:hypothetical protein BUALT_Bualt13G0013800 [Buddleja alternifolia]